MSLVVVHGHYAAVCAGSGFGKERIGRNGAFHIVTAALRFFCDWFGRIFTAYYFLFFLVVMPVVGWIEKPKALLGSITEAVLGPEAPPDAPPPKPAQRRPEAVL